MRIRLSLAAVCALFPLAFTAWPQSGKVAGALDAYHLFDWRGTAHLPDYTEWWYFNFYDSSNHIQGLFSYLINNPLNLPGGLFPAGIAEMAAVAFTPSGIVNEADIYPATAFSAQYAQANVMIGSANAITVIDPDTYRITGASQDGRMTWNLVYRRAAPSWYGANRFPVADQSWELMSWLLYMPRALVSGTLTIDGATYDIHAPGYHDHNWGEWNLNGVPWNWAQYSEPGLAFDLGDFPQKPGGRASIDVAGRRFVFENGQYTLTHTKWAYDPINKLYYPTQSIFQASNGTTQVFVRMDVQQTDPLSTPLPPPKAVIYEQLTTYTGRVSVNGSLTSFNGSGFKEYTGIAQ